MNTTKLRRFPSGAVRSDDTGRERPDFISPYAEKAVGDHFAGNSNDFGAVNYWKGIPEVEVLASIKRHFLDLQIAIYEGKTEDVRKNWQAITANCIMGLHTHEIIRLGLYKEVYDKTELVDVVPSIVPSIAPSIKMTVYDKTDCKSCYLSKQMCSCNFQPAG